jgi:hypothetical protein
MKPYADNIVTFGMLLRGYAQAFERFSLATRERDEVTTFVPLFEALNWAVALDDRCAQHWAPEGEPLGFAWRDRVTGAEVMRGVRWARNGVHHQWSDALVVEEGRQYPKRYPSPITSGSGGPRRSCRNSTAQTRTAGPSIASTSTATPRK